MASCNLPCFMAKLGGFIYKRPLLLQHRANYSRLIEVGKLQPVKKSGNYSMGQLFMHRVLAYRGIILFPWMARIYDRDLSAKMESSRKTDFVFVNNVNFDGDSVLFYQVLMDSRDIPHIRAQVEAMTFLGKQQGNQGLYSITGLDYVNHEDILPYSTSDPNPIRNDLFSKFFVPNMDKGPIFVPSEILGTWQKKNQPWLNLSDVHRETSENVRVTVIPFYMGSRTNQNTTVYWWRYCIRLENFGQATVQLRERHWRIFSTTGTLETIRDRGIFGQEPVLSRTHPAYQFSSHVSLSAPGGHMWGSFKMEREDGYKFECSVPPFSLESRDLDETPPEVLEN